MSRRAGGAYLPQNTDELSLVALNEVLRPDVAVFPQFRVANPDEISLKPCPQPGENSSLRACTPSKLVSGFMVGVWGLPERVCAQLAQGRKVASKRREKDDRGGGVSGGCEQVTGRGLARVVAASAGSVVGARHTVSSCASSSLRWLKR